MKLIIVRGPGALQRKAIPWREGKNFDKIEPNLGDDCLRDRSSHTSGASKSRPRRMFPVGECAQQKINIISAYTHCTSHRTNAWFVITSVSYIIPKAHNSSFIKHHTRESEWSGDENDRKGREGKWKRYDNIFFILMSFENRRKNLMKSRSLACLSSTEAFKGRMTSFLLENL